MVGNMRYYLALSLITKKSTDNNRAAHKFYHVVWDDKRNKPISCNPQRSLPDYYFLTGISRGVFGVPRDAFFDKSLKKTE